MKQWFISDHQRVDQSADSPVSSRALTAGTRTAASAAAEAAVRPAAPVEDIQVIRDMSILMIKKAKVAHIYSITKRRVPELIPVLVSQPSGDVSHKPGSRLPLLFARPAVIHATLKRAATSFAAW